MLKKDKKRLFKVCRYCGKEFLTKVIEFERTEGYLNFLRLKKFSKTLDFISQIEHTLDWSPWLKIVLLDKSIIETSPGYFLFKVKKNSIIIEDKLKYIDVPIDLIVSISLEEVSSDNKDSKIIKTGIKELIKDICESYEDLYKGQD